MSARAAGRRVDILLVEDNPADQRLISEILRETLALSNLRVAADGVEALAILHRQGKYAEAVRPDLILLDLNLPKKDGREVLAEIKEDRQLKRIPVVVLTSSEAELDIREAYDRHANCYLVKPLDLDRYLEAVRSLEDFWLTRVTLPSG